MANGRNEPVEFTRGDAERLRTIEVKQNTGHDKLDSLSNKLEFFITTHQSQHIDLDKRVSRNSRFIRIVTKVAIWVFTTSSGLGLIAMGAKAFGWLN